MHTRLVTKNDNLFLQVDDGEPKPVLGGWESFTGWYWFAVEMEGPHCFGYVQAIDKEWNYFDSDEIEASHICWKINPCDLPHAGRREVPAENLCAEPTDPVGDPAPSDWRQQAADWQRLK